MEVNMEIAENQEGLLDVEEGQSLIALVLEVGGVGAIGAAIAGIVAHFLSGVTGLQSIALVILIGFFTGLFYNTFRVLQDISSYLGEFAFVLQAFILLTGMVFVISLIMAVRQMGMGGDKAYE
jgi:hypothetical protein